MIGRMAIHRGYGQFCPVAKAAEVLAERWTPLILRELLAGSRHFNQLRRGIPLISPTMLSQRLMELENAEVLIRSRSSDGGPQTGWEYRLTAAGTELRPMIEQFGVWGQRWAQRQVRDEDLDPGFLMWAAHRHLPLDQLPSKHAVLLFEFTDVVRPSKRRWWLVITKGEVELCLKDPGHEVDLTVISSVRTMAEVYLGRLAPQAALRSGAIKLSGSPALEHSFARWCPRSGFAEIRRPAVNGERTATRQK